MSKSPALDALEGKPSDAALELIFDTASRRREPALAARALIASRDSSSATRALLWEHAYAPHAVIDSPSVLSEVGSDLAPSSLALFGQGLFDLVESTEVESRYWKSAEVLSVMISLVHRALFPDDEDGGAWGDNEPVTEPASGPVRESLAQLADRMASRSLILDLFETAGQRAHLTMLVPCLSSRDNWLSELLPTLNPRVPTEAALLAALAGLKDVPTHIWGPLLWQPLRGVPTKEAAVYAARLFDAAARLLPKPHEREMFASLHENWAGTLEELVSACRTL